MLERKYSQLKLTFVQLTILCFIFIKSAYASVDAYELILQNQDGKMLSEVSGVTNYKGFIFFVVQKADVIYFVQERELDEAFNQNHKALKLNPIKLTGKLPEFISWEAIAFGVKDKNHYLFLSHEHDTKGDVHQLYQALVSFNNNSVTIANLDPFGKPLPIATNKEISLERAVNYGYEAIVWDESRQRLIAVPELAEQLVVRISDKVEIEGFVSSTHIFRLSDMDAVSDSCAIFSSFCYTSDKVCETRNDTSVLSIVTAKLHPNNLERIDSKDITSSYLAVGFNPEINARKDKGRLFNAEGITSFKDGVLLVNDNTPRGQARTVVRYLPGISVNKNTCRFE